MKTNELTFSGFDEMTLTEMKEADGGSMIALLSLAVAGYMLYETAGNPVASWNAFKRGWDSVK